MEDGLLVVREDPDGWNRQYLFTLDAWPLSAYAAGCRYHQTSPRSTFTQKTVVSRATEAGRITLAGRRLIVTAHGERTETDLDEQAVSRALQEEFGIDPSLATVIREGSAQANGSGF